MKKEFYQPNSNNNGEGLLKRRNLDEVVIKDEEIRSVMLNVVDQEFNRFNTLNSSEIMFREEPKETGKTLPKLFFFKKFKNLLENELKNPKAKSENSLCFGNDEKYLYAIGSGKRIRPLLVMAGGLLNNKGEYSNQLIEIATSIELLHKSSVILDDLIDGDSVRSGLTSFYAKYGKEETINYFYKLVNLSQEKFGSVLLKIKTKGETVKAERLNNLYNEIINGMSKGCIMDLNKEPKTENETLIINDLQSSVLLNNSLLLGYVLSFSDIKDIDENTYQKLSEIGLYFGKIFQSFNDAEMFIRPMDQIQLKGSVYSDLVDNKKNVVCSKIPVDLRKKMSVEEQITYVTENNFVKKTIDEINNYVNELNNKMRAIPKSTGRTFLNFLFKKYLKKTFNLHSE